MKFWMEGLKLAGIEDYIRLYAPKYNINIISLKKVSKWILWERVYIELEGDIVDLMSFKTKIRDIQKQYNAS